MGKYLLDFFKEKNKSKVYICVMILLVIGWCLKNLKYKMISI